MGALARFAPGRRGFGDRLLRRLRHPALCRSTRFAGGRRADLHHFAGGGASAGDHAQCVFGVSRLAALRGYFEEALFANLVPQVGEQARLNLASFARNTAKLTAVGMVALAVSAVMLLMTIQSTLNRIFAVRHQRALILRVLVFWSLLTLGPVLLALALSLTSDLAQVARATVSDADFATGGFETQAG